MKLETGIENGDGREDIVFQENGVQLLVIRQEFYKPYGISYKEMKTPEGVAAFLAMVGLMIAKGSK